ncbi:MAG: hypothetical protein K6E99_03615 [Bacilli bacterium]|nr:hypothetical protein [Bacilli bacterium]
MKIDKKVNVYNTTASFVLFSLILVLGIVGMFMFLNLMGKNTSYPSEEEETTTTTSSKTTTTSVISNTISYVTNLSNIAKQVKIKDDFDVQTEYQGTNYYFKCTKYDSVCNTGFALLNYDNVSIPLFIFDNEEDNYLTNNKDYNIIVDGEYIILTYNNETIIYKKDGIVYLKIDRILTSYETNDSSISKVQNTVPVLTDDTLTYYSCDTNTVIKKELSLKNKQLNSSQKIDNGICE